MSKRIAIIIFLVLFIASCAGTPFNWDDARKITPGMNEQQLTDLMGRPYSVTARGDKQIWVWVFTDAFMASKSVSVVMQDGKVIEAPPIPASFN